MSTPERPVVDGAFNQKPILTRAVVAVAGLVAVAAIAGIAYALLKSDPTTAEEAKPPDAPTGLAVVADPATPGFVTLTWDEQSDVDSFVLLQTLPNSDSQPVDPPTNELRLRVATAEEYCYQLEAVREGAANSAPSDPPACATTTVPAERRRADREPRRSTSCLPEAGRATFRRRRQPRPPRPRRRRRPSRLPLTSRWSSSRHSTSSSSRATPIRRGGGPGGPAGVPRPGDPGGGAELGGVGARPGARGASVDRLPGRGDA